MVKTIHRQPLVLYTLAPLKSMHVLDLSICAIISMDYSIFFNECGKRKKGKGEVWAGHGGRIFRSQTGIRYAQSTGNAQENPG
jgi:hypothetical protein